jgi:hypothetical protein
VPDDGTPERNSSGCAPLPPRLDRLRPDPARPALARGREDRRADRRELRGGGREQHPPWRHGLRGVPVGDRLGRGLAGAAALEQGIDLRIRRAGRVLAAAPDAGRPAGDGLRRRHGAGARARTGGRDEGRGLGDREPRAEMDRVQGFLRGRGTRPHGRGDPASHRGRGQRPRGWYTGRTSMHTVQLAAEEGGFAYVADSYADELPYWLRFGGSRPADRALHARRQRHALRHAAGLQLRLPVRGLPEGQFRHALCRGGRGRAEDAVDRAALPPRRAPGPGRGAEARARLYARP